MLQDIVYIHDIYRSTVGRSIDIAGYSVSSVGRYRVQDIHDIYRSTVGRSIDVTGYYSVSTVGRCKGMSRIVIVV